MAADGGGGGGGAKRRRGGGGGGGGGGHAAPAGGADAPAQGKRRTKKAKRASAAQRAADEARAAAAKAPGGGNWARLQATLQQAAPAERKPKGGAAAGKGKGAAGGGAVLKSTKEQPVGAGGAVPKHMLTSSLAIDCEMVGIGASGSRSVLARVSIVNEHSETVYDSYCKPRERVVDFRTFVSGIRPHHIKTAPPLEVVRGEVARLMESRRIIGHAVHNDLNALQLIHPPHLIRDTAKYPPYLRESGKPMSLKDLALRHLGTSIQGGSHSSVDDARATMGLYLLHKKAWEAALAKGTALPQRMATAGDTHDKGGRRSKTNAGKTTRK